MHGNKKLPFIPAHLFKYEPSEEKPHKISLKELNKHFTCPLCDGYLVDATAIVECLHTFCKSCIVKYFLTEKENKSSCAIASITCPVCDTRVSETMPLTSLYLDRTMQDIINKLLPEIAKNEEKQRLDFYMHRPDLFNHDWKNKSVNVIKNSSPSIHTINKNTESDLSSVNKNNNQNILTKEEVIIPHLDSENVLIPKSYNSDTLISFNLVGSSIHQDQTPRNTNVMDEADDENFIMKDDMKIERSVESINDMKKYIRCSERSTIRQLIDMIRQKFAKPDTQPKISVYLSNRKLNPNLTIKQAAVIATLRLDKEEEEEELPPQNKENFQKISPNCPSSILEDDSSVDANQPFPYFTLRYTIE